MKKIPPLTASLSALWVLLATVVGCGLQKPQVTELLWPPPPQTPRIKFVGIIRNENDLGRTAGDLFAEALVGKNVPESFNQPMGIAPSRDGKRLYVTDYAKPGVFLIDLERRRMTPFGWGPGTAPTGHTKASDSGVAVTQSFSAPLGIALDDQDNVYVVDSTPKAVHVFNRDGKFLRSITHDSFERPTGIAIDSLRRRIYVTDAASKDSPNHVVRVFDMEGNYLMAFGGAGYDEGKLSFPSYLALDAEGNLYVADTFNGRVQEFDPEGHYLRTFGQRGDAVGQFDKPKGVALDTFGNLYVVDSSWSNVQIFNRRGEVLLFFGGRGKFPGLLFNPTGLAIDKANSIYVADAFNNRITIYQLINTKEEDSLMSDQAGG